MNKIALRAYTALILVRALITAIFLKKRGVAHETIAIVQMAKLGDMVCTTPLFRAVKEQYPNAKVIVFGNAINREVLEGNPHIDEYVSLDKSFFDTCAAFKSRAIDVLCVTGPSFDVLAAAVIARIPTIVAPRIQSGWSPYVTIPYTILSRFVITKDHHMGSYAPREYLRLLEPLAIYTEDTRKEVYYSVAAKTHVTQLFQSKNISGVSHFLIGILPGAGNEIKSWAPEKFAQLMNEIASTHQHMVFVLLGASKDKERADGITVNLGPHVAVIDQIGKLSLDELKACVGALKMVIGADTGPQYIAEALSVPTIDIVGPVDEREQPPMGDIHRIVKIKRERAELYVMNARVYNKEEALRQTDAITPQMVYTEFESLLSILQVGEVA